VRIERFLAAGASIKGAARKFAIDYHALRRVSAEARAAYIAGAGTTNDQLEEIVADESLGLLQEAIRAAVLRKHQSFQSVIRVIRANARVSEK
jgi:hypothetical protein